MVNDTYRRGPLREESPFSICLNTLTNRKLWMFKRGRWVPADATWQANQHAAWFGPSIAESEKRGVCACVCVCVREREREFALRR
jgi:hypothetical protein